MQKISTLHLVPLTYNFSRSDLNINAKLWVKKVREKSPGSATALPRHQEEEETERTKQAQIEQTYEKHQN